MGRRFECVRMLSNSKSYSLAKDNFKRGACIVGGGAFILLPLYFCFLNMKSNEKCKEKCLDEAAEGSR